LTPSAPARAGTCRPSPRGCQPSRRRYFFREAPLERRRRAPGARRDSSPSREAGACSRLGRESPARGWGMLPGGVRVAPGKTQGRPGGCSTPSREDPRSSRRVFDPLPGRPGVIPVGVRPPPGKTQGHPGGGSPPPSGDRGASEAWIHVETPKSKPRVAWIHVETPKSKPAVAWIHVEPPSPSLAWIYVETPAEQTTRSRSAGGGGSTPPSGDRGASEGRAPG